MEQNAIHFFIFDKDELSATLIENYLKSVSFPYQLHKFTEFDSSIITKDEGFYKFIFLNVTKEDPFVLDKVKECSANHKNIFFMMSSDPTTDLYIKALRAGAREFLRKPIEKDSFLSSIDNNYNPNMLLPAKTPKRGSRIIAATSIEKNCGKTFFAINLAYELAYISKEKVLLIDFNENLNNITFVLDIDQEFDTNYFVENINESNAKQFLPKVYKYKDLPLFIMSSCMYRAQTKINLTTNNVQNFFDAVKKYFRYIVIDVNSDIDKINNIIFENTDMIFYLISANVAANSRNKSYINTAFDKKKFRIILNKFREKDEVKLTEIENVLGREIFYKLPINLSFNIGFNNKGKTIREINPELDIVKKYSNLAKYVISRV